jgi:hypothetical protein
MKFYGDYEVYSESGVDLTLLRENLKRPFEVRWKQNARVLCLAQEFDRSRRANSHRTSTGSEVTRMDDFDAPAMLRQLTAGKVEFVVIGGLAMMAHGSANVTQDLDVCYSRSAENIARAAAALAPIHPYLRGAPPGLPIHFDAPTIQAGLNFTLITDLGDIDLLGEVSGIGGYAEALAQSEERLIFDMAIRVLSLDGLIAAKKAAGRGKDRHHLLELEELKKMHDAQP